MRVISQQRDYSVDFDRTDFWIRDRLIYAVVNERSRTFGVYESPERAAEVFGEMHGAYSGEPKVLQIESDEPTPEQIIQLFQQGELNCSYSAELIGNTVFYMPEV